MRRGSGHARTRILVGSGRGWGVVFVPTVLSGVGARTQDRVPGSAQVVRGYPGALGRPGQVAELAGQAV